MISPEIFIECVAQNACDSLADIILIELFDSHDRSVILSAEPAAALAVVSHRSRLRLSRVQASLTLRSACTRSFGTAEIDGVAAPRPSMRWRAGRECPARVCRQSRARWTPFRSQPEKRKRVR